MNSPSGIVIDASVAVKWHLRDEQLVEEAGLLLRGFLGLRVRLAAPSFIRYEIANSLEQARRRGRISGVEAVEELRAFLRFGVHAEQDGEALLVAALRIASRTGASVYDAMYVALSEGLGYDLITNDRALIDQTAAYPIAVHHLAEAPSFL